MKAENNNEQLTRKTFEDAIGEYLEEFLSYDGNYETIDGERYLKEEIPFYPSYTPQRNPRQVPRLLWRNLIRQHCFLERIN